MVFSLNKVILLGTIVKRPSIRYINEKHSVARFVITTAEVFLNQKDNQQHTVVDFHHVVCWNELAIFVDEKLKKGMQVYLEGRLKTHSREDKDEVKRVFTEIRADTITLISGNDNLQQKKSTIKEVYPNDEIMKPSDIHSNFNITDEDEIPF